MKLRILKRLSSAEAFPLYGEPSTRASAPLTGMDLRSRGCLPNVGRSEPLPSRPKPQMPLAQNTRAQLKAETDWSSGNINSQTLACRKHVRPPIDNAHPSFGLWR